MLDEREIGLLFPAMRVRKTAEGMVLVNGSGLGGTTTIAAGNGVRNDVLRSVGIDLDAEFDELEREIPISTAHRSRWRETTRRLFAICGEMGLAPRPLPKMGDPRRCTRCGRCVLGCAYGAKWDSRQFLRAALNKGATLVTRRRVTRVVTRGGVAVGVEARRGWRSEFYPADLVVLAAGGFGTPVILERSGIGCDRSLFVDPVLTVMAPWPGSLQNKEISMPFVVQRDGYIVSPYFDYLSYFFRRDWRSAPEDTLGLMVKIADSTEGGIAGRRVDKKLTDRDARLLSDGVGLCREIFRRLGVRGEDVILGTLNAGHPGGALPLTKQDAGTLHPSRLPRNVYVADASLFPASLGNPPILTIMALAKRVSSHCLALAPVAA
jgi:ferredoxin